MRFQALFSSRLVPFLVLALSLLGTGVASGLLARTARAKDRARLENAVQRASDLIRERLNIYAGALRGGAAFLAVNENPTSTEFEVYAKRLRLRENYPGIQGLGFAQRVLPEEKAAFIEARRAAGDSAFVITPAGERSEYFPIVTMEREDARIQGAIGYDMFSEPVRRAAMERARDEGRSAASDKETLVPESSAHPQNGFSIYAPVFRGGAMPSTVVERREELIGFVYVQFRADDLFAGIFGGERQPRVHFEVYDGERAVPEALLHRSPVPPSRSPQFTTSVPFEMAGQRWTLRFETTPEFEATSSQALSWWFLAGGGVFSLLLFGIAAALARARQEAAEERERYRVTLASIGDAVMATDGAGKIRFMNAAAEQLTGWEGPAAHHRPLRETFRIVHEFTREPVADPVRQVLAEGRTVGLANHTLLIGREGAEHPIEDSAAPIRDARGNLQGVVLVFRDVTAKRAVEVAQQRAQEEVRESQARLDGIIASAMDAIISTDARQRIVLFNPAAEKMFGVTAREALGQSIERFIPQRFRAAHAGHVGHFSQTGVSARRMGSLGAVSGVRASNEEFPVEASISQVEVRGEKIFTVILRDITDRRQAERALEAAKAEAERRAAEAQEGHRTLQALLKYVPEGIVITGGPPDFPLQTVSRFAFELSGKPAADLTGLPAGRHQTAWGLFKADGVTRPTVEEMPLYRATRLGEETHNLEMVLQTASGEKIPVLVNAAPIRDGAGRIVAGVNCWRDVRELMLARDSIQRSEQHLRDVLDNLFVFVGVLTPDGTLIELNRPSLQVSGVPLAEVVDRKFWDCYWWSYSPDVQVRVRQAVERAARGEPSRYDTVVRLTGDRMLLIDFMLAPMRDAQGKITHLIPSGVDITERKRAEDALREAQEKLQQHAADLETTVAERTAQLRETVAELEAFSYSLSHDMRAPLRAIQSFTQMVLAECGERLGSPAAGFLQRVVASAQRMDRLIQDVLAFTRLSRQAIEVESIEVEQLLRDILHERPELQAPRVQIDIVSPLLPMLGHEASLTQCLTNLLGNAVKFVAPGVQPRVRIWTERLSPTPAEGTGSASMVAPSGGVRLWVEDNGIGIDREGQRQLFKMFHRLSGDHAYEGTGIGLAIVRKAVERMGGAAGVESELSQGSRFWIQLPGANP